MAARTLRPLGALRAFCALGALRTFCPLGSLRALGPLDAMAAALDSRDAIFAPLGASRARLAQVDADALAVLAHAHALEIEVGAEPLRQLGELLAVLRGKIAAADAHVARIAFEAGADVGFQLRHVYAAVAVARNGDVAPFPAIFLPVGAAILLADIRDLGARGAGNGEPEGRDG